jgi:hypothetical protein
LRTPGQHERFAENGLGGHRVEARGSDRAHDRDAHEPGRAYDRLADERHQRLPEVTRDLRAKHTPDRNLAEQSERKVRARRNRDRIGKIRLALHGHRDAVTHAKITVLEA